MKQPDETEAKPFAEFLLEQPRSHNELSDALRDLASRVEDTGKKGTLTYVVTIEPAKAPADAFMVSDEIKLKLPEFARPGAIFWADKDHNLLRSDPNQPSFFDQITQADGTTASVNPTTGEVQ